MTVFTEDEFDNLDSCKPKPHNIDPLNIRLATESYPGITQIARQDEVNNNDEDFKYITPKKLSQRIATSLRAGLVKIGPGVDVAPDGTISVDNSGGGGDVDWDAIADYIDQKLSEYGIVTEDRVDELVDDKVNEVLDDTLDDKVNDAVNNAIGNIVVDGVIDINNLRITIDAIIKDHPRITGLITEYQLPTTLSVPYNNAYTDLMVFINPYLNGSIKVVDDLETFSLYFENYYTAKANIEAEVLHRLGLNKQQAERTQAVLDRIIDFNAVQIFPAEGVIVGGTLAVGTPTYNNAGITGVTEDGNASVRFWAGTDYSNRNSAPFRVLNDGRIWAGGSGSGFDYGITAPNQLTIRGSLFIDPNTGEPIDYDRYVGEYSPSGYYYRGNMVRHNGSLWRYFSVVSGNGGEPNDSNTNWELVSSSGVGAYTSTVFTRSAIIPAIPTGGSYISPYPTVGDWHDTPPAGTLDLYATSRLFTESGAAPQQPTWSEPRYVSEDPFDLNNRWSHLDTDDPLIVGNPTTHPENWGGTSIGAKWWAIRTIKDGVESPWEVVQIGGEGPPGADGADGISVKVEYRYRKNTSPQVSPPPPAPGDRYPMGWTVLPPSDFNPTALEYLWRIEASIRIDDDAMLSVWSDPYLTSGVRGSSGADGDDGPIVINSEVFRRTATDISSATYRPVGGTVENPIPNGGLWTRGVPYGTETVWMSRRVFSSDPTRQEEMWSIPMPFIDTPEVEFCYSIKERNPSVPGLIVPDGTWVKVENENHYWGAMRTKRGAITGNWSPWYVFKMRGDDGPEGPPGRDGIDGRDGIRGTTAPIIVNMDEWQSDTVYEGTTELINFVLYGGRGYRTRTDVGYFSNVPPLKPDNSLNSDYWIATEMQLDSLLVNVLNATTASIEALSSKKVAVGEYIPHPTNPSVPVFTGVTIGFKPNNLSEGGDPTNAGNFRLYGIRMYYPSGRIQKYDGYVENFTYTLNGTTYTVTGSIEIVWEDKPNSPVFSVDDGTRTDGKVYPTPDPVSWNRMSNGIRLGGSTNNVGATNNELLNELFLNVGDYYLKGEYWCGTINAANVELGFKNNTGAVWARNEEGVATRYRTQASDVSGTTIASGWYCFYTFTGAIVDIWGNGGHNAGAEMNLSVTLQYITGGLVTATRTLSNISVYADGTWDPNFTVCQMGTDIITIS